jgi:hypothetical protein
MLDGVIVEDDIFVEGGTPKLLELLVVGLLTLVIELLLLIEEATVVPVELLSRVDEWRLELEDEDGGVILLEEEEEAVGIIRLIEEEELPLELLGIKALLLPPVELPEEETV